MDLNYTLNYSFNPENVTNVMPYNQDLVITLLAFIAVCQAIRIVFLIGGFIERIYGFRRGR